MKPTKTPHNDGAQFIASLGKRGFSPARWDAPGCRILDHKANSNVRIVIDHEGEPNPHSITIVKFDDNGTNVTEWQHANMSAHMPTKIFLAMIDSILAL